MRRLLPCVARCSLLLAACSPFASAAVLCCPFALPGLLRWLPGWLLPNAAALSSMQGLPWSGNSSAQTSASLHPPASLRLRVLPFTRGMVAHGLCGRVPDSAVNLSPWIASAQTDANLSAHLHRLPTPPPYLRRMRLFPGRVHRYWVPEVAAVWLRMRVLGAG